MKRSFAPLWKLAGILCLLPLTGCDNDRPVSDPPPSPPPPAASGSPSITAGTSSDAKPPDEFDPLLQGGSRSRNYSDPLLSSDPLQGRAMPTLHSHWLRGRLHNAHLTVLLNSARQGTYYGPVDKDITMRLRKGLNSVTFVYQPDTPNSSAQMQVIEGEHDPPIAPLVTFQGSSVPDESKLQPLTKTFRFIAN